jgi:hypothetical protein
MSKTPIWPRYRTSTWIDTSPESMAQPSPTVRYGIQRKSCRNGKWLHVTLDGKTAALFNTEDEAALKCDELNAEIRRTLEAVPGGAVL